MPEKNIQRGMTVYTADNQRLGTIEDLTGNNFMVNGRQYPLNSGYRVEGRNVYLTGAGGADYAGTGQDNLRVPVYEEQLNVDKRQANLGEVQVNKTVNQEQVNVPVELRREEVNVSQRDVEARPLNPGEAPQAFQEGTIRVPVRGEEAIVNKQPVVTGEVNIEKQVRAERQNVADTVRREQVNVDDSSIRQGQGVVRETGDRAYDNRSGNYGAAYQRDNTNYAGTDYATGQTGYNTQAGQNYTASNIQEGSDVVGNDGQFIGRVKELNDNGFRVDRKMKPDIDVTYTSIQNLNGGQVVLNGPGADYNNLI